MLQFLCYLIAFVMFVIAAIIMQNWVAKLIPAGLALLTLPLLVGAWPG